MYSFLQLALATRSTLIKLPIAIEHARNQTRRVVRGRLDAVVHHTNPSSTTDTASRRPPALSLTVSMIFMTSLSSSFSLCQGWGAACNFFTASSASLFHPPLSPVFFFQSPSTPAFFTSLLTQSSHLSCALPRLLLPCSRNSAALFDSLSSAILSTCPAHCSLLLTSLSAKLLCTPVSYLNSPMSHNIMFTMILCSIVISRISLQRRNAIAFTVDVLLCFTIETLGEEEEEEERFIFPTTTTLVHTLNKFIKLKFYTWLEKKR